MTHRVLFVSKPIIAPYRDGSKCFVRELANHLQKVDVEVMSTTTTLKSSDELTGSVRRLPVYAKAGGFTPGVVQNARAAIYLALLSRADLWHFVFAPNPTSSLVGRLLSRFRRTPIIQTIASKPRDFRDTPSLLFGDIVVAQSSETKRLLEDSYQSYELPPRRIEYIPPPAPEKLPMPTNGDKQTARRQLGISPNAPLILYPGDLEVSRGAIRSVEIAGALRQGALDAVTVIAYRRKTEAAAQIALNLESQYGGPHLKFAEEVKNIFALVAAADLIIFPVDDLYGKVDIPIILLEAFQLGTPVLVSDEGSLKDLASLQRVALCDDEFSVATWAERIQALFSHTAQQQALIAEGRLLVGSVFSAGSVAAAYQRLYAELLPNN